MPDKPRPPASGLTATPGDVPDWAVRIDTPEQQLASLTYTGAAINTTTSVPGGAAALAVLSGVGQVVPFVNGIQTAMGLPALRSLPYLSGTQSVGTGLLTIFPIHPSIDVQVQWGTNTVGAPNQTLWLIALFHHELTELLAAPVPVQLQAMNAATAGALRPSAVPIQGPIAGGATSLLVAGAANKSIILYWCGLVFEALAAVDVALEGTTGGVIHWFSPVGFAGFSQFDAKPFGVVLPVGAGLRLRNATGGTATSGMDGSALYLGPA